jgi:riboflavin synthase
MFTGIVQEIGEIESLKKSSSLTTVVIKTTALAQTAEVSDSVAVNGVCLTVTKKERDVLYFDAVGPTLAKTNLKRLKRGEKVNLEPALKVGDKLGGHFVLGHVDCEVKLRRAIKQKEFYILEVEFPVVWKKYIIANGSIAIDGISLTIKKVFGRIFTVAVIPFTWAHTTLKDKKPGSYLNLECDYLLKQKSSL